MSNKLLSILTIVAFMATTAFAGWENKGAFPDTSFKGGTHGIAVDPDGKIWVSSYYKDVDFIRSVEGDTILTSGILVFNEDGSPADISPVIVFPEIPDTINGSCRGMTIDENGNIVFVQSGPSKAIKINYQTGAGMASALLPETGSSPTGPAVSSDGTVFIGPVVGGDGKAIAMYDTDLSYLGNAVDGPPNISRTLEVSADGNTIYWPAFTGPQETIVYQRADEFSTYDSVASLFNGMSVETIILHPITGNLWVSNDSRGTDKTVANLTWFEYDLENNKFLDSFSWDDTTTAPDQYPRGFDFSVDGKTAYFGTFAQGTARVQKATNTATSIIVSDKLVPSGYSLKQNYPNPFNPNTTIKYTIPNKERVTLKIYDMLGREVATLVNEVKIAGSYQVDFNALNLSTGMYVYRITAGKFTANRRMMLIK